MANVNLTGEDLVFEYDSNGNPVPVYRRDQPWQLSMAHQSNTRQEIRREIAPLRTGGHGIHQHLSQHNPIADWRVQHYQQPLTYPPTHANLSMQYQQSYNLPLHNSPTDLLPVTQAQFQSTLPMDNSFMPMAQALEQSFMIENLQADLVGYSTTEAGIDMSSYHQHSSSPTGSHLEVRSLTSASSNDGWSAVDRRSFEFDRAMYVDPNQTVHNRTLSESSYSDLERPSNNSFVGSFQPHSHAIHSPSTDSISEYEELYHVHHQHGLAIEHDHSSQPSNAVTPALIRAAPVPISKATSPARSPSSQESSSPPASKKFARKSPTAKSTEKVIKKQSQSSKGDAEKKVGRRKGPLNPDQRKQANEIRKLRACLRCKFLKKTCDKGEPCNGCQPSHARLWQVPCTRIDIKEIGFFMKDWKADYERHVTMLTSINNIKGFADTERTLFITHGYGHVIPVKAREVYVRDEKVFGLDWVESFHDKDEPTDYEIATAKLTCGMEGVSSALLSDYLDRHIDGNGSYERFIQDYFEGTPFLTEMLTTAYRYYFRTNLPVIRKALKLVLAYTLTLHITMVEGVPGEEGFSGKIEEETSKFFGKTMAPVMINFQIKAAMADMWRDLQRDVLEELSALYSSVYSGDKLKNWPTIFILATMLLAVWECMQFDCHYRVPDNAAVDKFCNDMETTPVGVIVGLFQAISQKLPSFAEWDTNKHHNLLNSDRNVCATMEEVRDNVQRYENYLRGRSTTKFDRKDFDSLSNKFLSKLVIRAN